MSTTCLPAPIAASPAPAEVAGVRLASMDLARLAAAYGIVWIHSVRNPALAGSQALGRFAVPFFVFATVFFVFDGLRRRPERTFAEYARSRFVRIYLPFLAWSGIYLLFKLAKGLLLPEQPNEYPGLNVLWTGTAYHLWFLPFILAVSLVAFGIGKTILGRRHLQPAVFAVAVVAGIVLAAMPTAKLPLPAGIYGRMLAHALPAVCWAVALAIAAGHPAAHRLERPAATVAAGLLAVASTAWVWHRGSAIMAENLAGLGLMVVALGPSGSAQKQVGHDFIVPGTLESCPTVNTRQSWIRRSLTTGWLRRLGTLGPLAYGIYLAHLLFIKVFEALTVKLGLAVTWELDVGVFLLAAAGSTWLAWGLSRRPSTRWLVA